MTTVGVTWRHAEQMINGIQLPQLLTTSQPYHQYMVMPFQVVQSLCFNDHFPGGPGLAGTRMSPFWTLMELRMMEVVSGDNWSYKTCKAPVKSSPPTDQHFTGRMPFQYRSNAWREHLLLSVICSSKLPIYYGHSPDTS